MFGLEYFSLSAQWSPFFLLFIVLVGAAYWLATGSCRERFAQSGPVPLKKKLYFLLGLAVVYLAFGSPVDLLGHLFFSAHMVSMSLGYLAAPPLLLLGMPEWMLRPVIGRLVSGKWRFLLHPIVTLVLFNALFSFYHMPAVHDYVMTHYTAHVVYYIALFIAAMLMWWHMVNPLPEYRRFSGLRQIAYVFADGVLLTPACALIIFAGTPLYGSYSDASVWVQAMGFCAPGMDPEVLLERFGGPQYFALMDPVHDQQLGGVIMKLMQEILYGTALFNILIRWYRSENPKDSLEPANDRDVPLDAGELNRA